MESTDVNAVGALPDFDRKAVHFDLFLPLIQPVGLAVLGHLPKLPEGANVLDVACGTGEPGLTLARLSPSVHLLGIDSAAGMIEVARRKAAYQHLTKARFEVASAETLSCADGSMDAVISRFGLMLFGDTAASAGELARVLRPGGHFSLAVWDDMAENRLVKSGLEAFSRRLPAELLPPFERLAAGAAAARRLLSEAGLAVVESELFRWNMEFANQSDLRQFLSLPEGLFSRQFAELNETNKEQVRSEVMGSLGPYLQNDGRYQIPHTCRLLWGQR
jgi:ubiquinone/menaquinone biosynthesis C-methylase UbiE